MKKFFLGLSMMWEYLKSFIIAVLIGTAIILATCSILHNVFKIREIYAEDKTGYKSLVTVDSNRMNVKVTGERTGGTVVILPDFAESSPIIKYKPYSDRLSPYFKVATVEYFGYGYSLSSKTERSNAQLAREIKSALTSANLSGPYIFLATGTSSMYLYTYSKLYPEDIQKMVIVDGVYPNSINDEYTKQYVDDLRTNAVITSYAELTGYARILSYVYPEAFHIDQMKDNGFSKLDIKTYRKMIANRYYTGSMKREAKALSSNMSELQNYVYPNYMSVTQILSDGYINEVSKLVSDKKTKIELDEYANDMITNFDIQKIVTVEGGKSNLSLDNPDAVIQEIINY